jgi:hypothetical protein
MKDITFLFYTHSDYADLWEVLKDTTSKLIPTKYKRLVAVNANAPNKPVGFDGVLTYDDSLNYSDKVLSLINQISTEYVAFIHDNDLILSFSNSIFTDIFNIIKANNIDRFIFGIIGRNNGTIHHPHFNLVNSRDTRTTRFRIPYDVGPSIWKVAAFKSALAVVPNTSYRDIEDSAIQKYCTDHLNIYGFSNDDTKPAYYVIGRPFLEPFQFLHMFVRGKMYEPYVYMDQEANFVMLKNKYPILLNRPMADDSYGTFHNLCGRTV